MKLSKVCICLSSFFLHRVDLCHQATDREEEEDEEDEENHYERLPSCENSRSSDKPRWCCLTFKQLRVRGRQKFVVLVRTNSQIRKLLNQVE